MEVRIIFFLALVSFTFILNTLAILFIYRGLARMSSRVAEAASEFRESVEVQKWIGSLQVATERAVTITEATKRKFAELDPALEQAQANYRTRLADMDSKLEFAADRITTTARDVRDAIAKPAFAVASFAAGMTKVLERTSPED